MIFDVVQCAFFFDMVNFCVRNRGFVAWTPVNWVCALIHEALLVQLDEAELCATPVVGVHGFIFGGPIDGCTHFEDAFLHHGDVFLDEFDAPCAELVGGYVPFADVFGFFNLDFYAQSVAVPALWEQHVVALHAFVAGYHVEVCPVQHVAHVEFA